MKRQRKCRGCLNLFYPDPRSYHPTGNPCIRISPQRFCSKPQCRRKSRYESTRRCLKKNLAYRQTSLMAARRWRKRNSHYWKQYRKRHPQVVKRNRLLQRRRDARVQAHLANNNTIHALHGEKLRRIETLIDLANINTIEVPWTRVSEEICLYLKWRWPLANMEAIGNRGVSATQSPA